MAVDLNPLAGFRVEPLMRFTLFDLEDPKVSQLDPSMLGQCLAQPL